MLVGDEISLDKFIDTISNAHPELKLGKKDYKLENEFINDLSKSIEQNAVNSSKDPVDWVYDNYVRKDQNPKDSMELTTGIMKDFNELFAHDLGPFGSNSEYLDKFIYPEVITNIQNDRAQFLFPAGLLRKWDTKKRSPATDDKGNYIPGNIYFDAALISSKNNRNIEIDGYANPCMDTTEISGTGILFQSNSVIPIPQSVDIEEMERGDKIFGDYFRAHDSINWDDFSGIYWQDAKINIPVYLDGKAKYIKADRSSLWASGKIIIGSIVIKAKEDKPGIYKYVNSTGNIKFSLSDIKADFAKRENCITDITMNDTSDGYKEIRILFTIKS